MNIDQAHVSLTALDATYIASVQSAGECKRLLREAFLLSEFAHPLAELNLDSCFATLIHQKDGSIMDDEKSTDFAYPL